MNKKIVGIASVSIALLLVVLMFDFTELFDSEKFGDNYGNLVSKELELTKHWNNITNVILQSVNLPSKEEIDEVYKEIHSLKKRVSKLELELKKEKRKNAK